MGISDSSVTALTVRPLYIDGPLIKPQQCAFIAGQIAEAEDKGASVLTGIAE